MKKEVVKHIMHHFGLSARRSCSLSLLQRSTFTYKPRKKNDFEIIQAMDEILEKNSYYGCPMIHLKLRQKGFLINHKRTERIYKERGLQLPIRKRRKKIAAVSRTTIEVPKQPGVLWAMDFVSDSIAFERKMKILTAIDPAGNMSPLIHVSTSINGREVADRVEQACEIHGYPEFIQCDNGPEFRSKELDKWCYEHGVKLIFTRPGKPTDNAHIESFNGTFRNECLNSNYFSSIKQARKIIFSWWNEYNHERPQRGLSGMTPVEYSAMLLDVESNPTSGRKVG